MPSFADLTAIRGLWATVVGVGLVIVAVLAGGAWFVPLLVIGGVLIAAGVFGPRVRGRFSLEFGEGGMTLDIQLHLAPPGQVGRLPRRGVAPAAAVVAPAEEPVAVAEPVIVHAPAPAAATAPSPDPAAAATAVIDAIEAVRRAAHSNGNGNGVAPEAPAAANGVAPEAQAERA